MSTRSVVLYSFAYRDPSVLADLPVESKPETLTDCRGVRNPHNVRKLRDLDGRDPKVAAFVMGDDEADELVGIVVDRVVHAGQGIHAFGCYGGRHRSVAMAEAAATRLRAAGKEVEVRHLALGK